MSQHEDVTSYHEQMSYTSRDQTTTFSYIATRRLVLQGDLVTCYREQWTVVVRCDNSSAMSGKHHTRSERRANLAPNTTLALRDVRFSAKHHTCSCDLTLNTTLALQRRACRASQVPHINTKADLYTHPMCREGGHDLRASGTTMS